MLFFNILVVILTTKQPSLPDDPINIYKPKRKFQKVDDNLLDVFHRNCLQIVLGTWLTDHISNSRLYKKCGSILLSRAIMKERLRWLGHILQMKDDKLPKVFFFGQLSTAKRKASCPCLG